MNTNTSKSWRKYVERCGPRPSAGQAVWHAVIMRINLDVVVNSLLFAWFTKFKLLWVRPAGIEPATFGFGDQRSILCATGACYRSGTGSRQSGPALNIARPRITQAGKGEKRFATVPQGRIIRRLAAFCHFSYSPHPLARSSPPDFRFSDGRADMNKALWLRKGAPRAAADDMRNARACQPHARQRIKIGPIFSGRGGARMKGGGSCAIFVRLRRGHECIVYIIADFKCARLDGGAEEGGQRTVCAGGNCDFSGRALKHASR